MKRKNKQQNSQGIQNIKKPRPEGLQSAQSTSRKDQNWKKPQIIDMDAQYHLSQQSQLPFMQPFGQNGLSFGTALLPSFATFFTLGITHRRPSYNLFRSTSTRLHTQGRSCPKSGRGAVENYQVIPDKLCAFVSFVEPSAVQVFYHELMCKGLKVKEVELKREPHDVGELDKTILEQKWTGQMIKYGAMEGVRMIKEKQCAFVDDLSIASAVQCISELSYAKDWKSNPVRFSKDPCVGHSLNAAKAEFNRSPTFGFDPLGHSLVASLDLKAPVNGGMVLCTIYIGHLPPGTAYEDICNVVRGSHVLKVKLMPEKHIAFVSFVDESAAALAVNLGKTQGMIIKHRKVKVGWGKPSAIPDEIAQAIEKDATRNVYVGGMSDEVTDEKLRNDFEGIESAVAAVAGIQSKIKEYRSLHVNYGKDQCAHPPRMKENVDHEKSKVKAKPENEEIKESEREAKEEDEMKIANEERGEKSNKIRQ
ncbi:hypothetical protein G6F37_007565 [Rhizopus arrhizus]|nr:hypothetical protein G6F38_011782 [Rhizopus arrhizus]KAG1156478.1 hypothetical protein G6F37_007565 [Rhizopus arrhizus]